MSQLVKLPSGWILDADRIVMMLKSNKAVGQYGVLMIGGGELVPNIDGNDVDALIKSGVIRDISKMLSIG